MVGSSHNARLLIENGKEIDPSKFRGNALSRRCLASSLGWLEINGQFASSGSIFDQQFMEPVRAAARFIVNARTSSVRTTKLSGIVVSKWSPYFSKYFNDINTIGVIFPEIQSVMSFRNKADRSEQIKYRVYEFEGIQPFPYINRVHAPSLRLKQATITIFTSL
jgi:hypothetical protein